MKLRLAITLLAFLGLTACSTFSKASEKNLYQVHVGESKADLLASLGEPESKAVTGSTEKWFYNVYADNNRKTYPYTAVFEDGILKHWDFDTARNSPTQEPRENRKPSSQKMPY